MTFLEFVYIMFLKGCLRAAKGYCFWCITLCFVLLQSCVCLGKLYFIPEKLFFIYKAIGMSGCLTHIHCMEHCKHVSWFVFSKYVFCKCIPCAFQQLEIIFYTVGHQKITFLYFGDPFLGFSTTFDKICCQTITDVIFGNKNWPKKTPPPPPFSMLFCFQVCILLCQNRFGVAGACPDTSHANAEKIYFKTKNSIESGGRGRENIECSWNGPGGLTNF